MLTDITCYMQKWSNAYHNLLKLTYSNKKYNRQPSKHWPRSTATLAKHRDIPRYIPNYNQLASYDIQYAEQKRKQLFHARLTSKMVL